MKECLNRLRRNREDRINDLLKNKDRLRNMILNALNRMKLSQYKVLNSLMKHKQEFNE